VALGGLVFGAVSRPPELGKQVHQALDQTGRGL